MLRYGAWLQSHFEDFGKKPSQKWSILSISTLALLFGQPEMGGAKG